MKLRALIRRFQAVDWAVVAVCGALVVLSFSFCLTNGLIADWDPELGSRYVGQYQSTGSDDDRWIQVGVLIFGICALAIGWWASPHRFVALAKALLFTPFWILQLWAIDWIEIGSIRLTLIRDHNAVLWVWMLVYLSSLPAIWLSAVLSRGSDASDPKQPQS